jgi:hypothetical protein
MTVGDFNNDTKLDLAVTNKVSTEHSISLLLGREDGIFQRQTKHAAGPYSMSVTVADFNNDKKLDLAVTNFYRRDIGVLLGNGNGTF